MDSHQTLQTLTQRGDIWSGQHWLKQSKQHTASHYPALDESLPGGGWPLGAVTELLCEHWGIGELRLLMPALKQLCQQDQRWLVWLNPPHTPSAPALCHWQLPLEQQLVCQPKNNADLLWTIERCLAANSCCALLCWSDQLNKAQLRRIQLAAEKSQASIFLFRTLKHRQQPSTAALRLSLHSQPGSELQIHILKSRGGWKRDDLRISIPLFSNSRSS